ncbi:hypothetical protein BH11BAC3_BH11BAC3_28500 [soil metagenome]
MKRNIIYILGICTLLLANASCKKEDTGGSGTKAVFSYVADGYKVNFTNFSSNATEYLWDFGDGSNVTSTLKSPLHVFKQKGDFLVSLTAKSGAETSTFIDTVSVIGPNIKIDGDFSDWEYVSFSYENDPAYVSSMRSIKTFASSDYIFFYIEGTTDMKMDILDIYLDGDNNPATGFNTYLYPAGSGADFLFEGSPSAGWGDAFTHSGPVTAFSWTPFASFADVMTISPVKTSAGKNIIEFSIKKSALGTTSKFINFGMVESTSGWAEIGKMPAAGTPDSKFLAVPL